MFVFVEWRIEQATPKEPKRDEDGYNKNTPPYQNQLCTLIS